MTKKFVTSLALAAGCAMALTIPAVQAQTMNTQVLSNGPRFDAGDRAGWLAARNNAESAQYDRLLEVSPAFRHSRVRRECGPITDPQLRQQCFASFAQYEPRMGSRNRTMASGTTHWYPRARATTGDMYTGSSTYPGMTGYNYQSTYSSNNWGGLGTMPNTPGPRPSGSGGGSGATSFGAGR